jgi:hypothetical protein
MKAWANGLTHFERVWPPMPLWMVIVLGMAFGMSSAKAHRTDEYLQATLIDIEPRFIRLDVSLTPGIETFSMVGPLLDRDHDGDLSPAEAASYAEQVRMDLQLRVDGQPLELELQNHQFPVLQELRDGTGSIHIEMKARFRSESADGIHQLSFENHHLSAISVYLVNAVVPDSTEIQTGQQFRSTNQSDFRISYERILPRSSPPLGAGKTVRRTFSWDGPIILASILAIVWGCVLWRRGRHDLGRS